MAAAYALIVADNVLPPASPGSHPGAGRTAEYEAEHSERQATGSVAVGEESRWVAALAVPMTGDQSALVTIVREGPTLGSAPSVPEVTLVVPPGEFDALLTLLQGIVAHARRDGVLARRRGRAQERPG
jgi:hypothetical protein